MYGVSIHCSNNPGGHKIILGRSIEIDNDVVNMENVRGWGQDAPAPTFERKIYMTKK
jgi:hypothetical protein